MNAADLDATVATVWRVESPRVLARLARFVGDLDTAEELAQDTFVAAIEKWRQDGGPASRGHGRDDVLSRRGHLSSGRSCASMAGRSITDDTAAIRPSRK